MIRCILIIAIVVSCFSCKESIPSEIIKPEKMQDILWDILKADALSQQITTRDSAKSLAAENIKLTNQVFLIHNITKEQFEKSYSYYVQHPDIMRTILDSITAKQTRMSYVESPEQKRLMIDSVK